MTHNGYTLTTEEVERKKRLFADCQRPRRAEPGDLLAAVIHAISGERACVPCDRRRRTMNGWGWWGCWRRRATIVGWILEEASKRGHAVDGSRARALFRAAIEEMRSRR
jgi:hypothetical protein